MKKSNTRKICVLVTGVGGRSVGHQILHALKLMNEKYRTVCVDADPFSFGLYQGDARYIIPLANDPNYLPAIVEIVNREQIRAILPGTEDEVLQLTAHIQSFIEEDCTIVANPYKVVALCKHKGSLSLWLEKNGFPTPYTVSFNEWKVLINKVGFPIVAKPASRSGGSKNVAILANEEEVETYLREVPDEVIFQEYVSTPNDEYTVGVMVSKSGDVIDSIILHRKLIGLSLNVRRRINNNEYSLSTGYSQGYIVKHDIIQRRCEELALKIGARGPMNIQLRFDNGDIKVFEVHPRFSGTTSIRAEVGFNEPDILIQNFIKGKRFNRIIYKTDVAAIRAFQHLIVPIDVMNLTERIKKDE